MDRLTPRLIVAAVSLVLLGMSVTSPVGAQERGRDGTLSLFYWQAPTILNPHLSPGTKDLSAARIVYEPLASFDAEGNLVPFLAAEIPTLENGDVAPDGTSVTWRLKPGVTWSDGEPFTAEDVRFTWLYATDPEVGSTSAGAFAGVEDVVVLDDTTVRIDFDAPNPAWATPFVGVQGQIIPEHVFSEWLGPGAADAPANWAPVGTGPFAATSFESEDFLFIGGQAVPTTRITYEANPLYRDPHKPAFSDVVLSGGGGNERQAVAALVDGATDFAWNLQVNDADIEALEADGDSAAISLFGAFTERIMLNLTDPDAATADGERSSTEFPHPFLSDPAVRLAIAHAVDRDAIVELYGRGGQAAETLLVSPGNMKSDHPAPPFDLDEAVRLLDEAGWVDSDGDGVRDKDGVDLRLLFQTSVSPTRQRVQDIVERDLETIGIDVRTKAIDSSVFFGPVEGTTETRRQFYADLEEFAYSNKSPDPAAYMAAWTCAEAAQAANDWALSNWSRYCDADYDALFAEAAATIDPERRAELFKELNDFLVDHAAVIPLVHLADVSGAATDLEGLDLTPWDVDVWNIADWHRS